MRSQMLVGFENISEFRPTSFQRRALVNKQLLTLLQREIHAMEQNCIKFERQYREFVGYHQNLLSSVAT